MLLVPEIMDGSHYVFLTPNARRFRGSAAEIRDAVPSPLSLIMTESLADKLAHGAVFLAREFLCLFEHGRGQRH